jgi:hypothetical protein
MSPSQPLCKARVAYTKSPDVTVAIGSAGEVSVNAAKTSPTSSMYVTAAATFTGICIRTGVDGKSQGSCVCGQVIDLTGGGHVTARTASYTIKPGAEGSGEAAYKIVPIDGAVLAFGSTGEIRVGTGN